MPRCLAFSSLSAVVWSVALVLIAVSWSSAWSGPACGREDQRSSPGSVPPSVLNLYWWPAPIRRLLGAAVKKGAPMSSYGQFCPVAKAMEVLDERWTILVVRELLAGSTRFNELRRGNPRMSPALLSKRLRTLERAGLVRRDLVGAYASYTLTPSGEDLREIVMALGTWGTRWIGELGEADLDPHLLMWDIKRTVPVDEWPRSRTA